MSAGLRMLRQAAVRQVSQSLVAGCISLLAFLALAALAALARALVALAREHQVPIGEVPTLLGLGLLGLVTAEELIVHIIRGSALRLRLLATVLIIQLVAWVAVAITGKLLGVEEISASGVLIHLLIYLVTVPLANLVMPGQTCQARLRRTIREIKAGVLRLSVVSTAALAVLYVYLTVFTQLSPAMEVIVMGLGMPVLQAVLMSALAWLMGRQERNVRRAASRKSARAPGEVERSGLKMKQHQANPALVMVLSAEIVFSTSAFATLALSESDGAFYLALVAMLAVEIVQVALHVKTRRVVARVVAEGTAEMLLGDNRTIREWLLHQELGEKIGLLVAIGFLGIDRAFGRDVLAEQALTLPRLAFRGLAMVSLELVGDFGKDLVGQALGILPTDGTASMHRVLLTASSVAVTVLMGYNAGFLVQIGLALGS